MVDVVLYYGVLVCYDEDWDVGCCCDCVDCGE